jgi:hypothetical protein
MRILYAPWSCVNTWNHLGMMLIICPTICMCELKNIWSFITVLLYSHWWRTSCYDNWFIFGWTYCGRIYRYHCESKIASRTISTYYTTSYRSICGIIYWTYYCTSKYMSAFWLIDNWHDGSTSQTPKIVIWETWTSLLVTSSGI